MLKIHQPDRSPGHSCLRVTSLLSCYQPKWFHPLG